LVKVGRGSTDAANAVAQQQHHRLVTWFIIGERKCVDLRMADDGDVSEERSFNSSLSDSYNHGHPDGRGEMGVSTVRSKERAIPVDGEIGQEQMKGRQNHALEVLDSKPRNPTT
jgi:hypothetical protein